jgi:hypothetical protein
MFVNVLPIISSVYDSFIKKNKLFDSILLPLSPNICHL